MGQNEDEPAWLSEDNDKKLVEATAPLLDPEEGQEEKAEEGNYGSVDNGKEQKHTKEQKAVQHKLIDPETLLPHQPPINPCLWIFHLLEGISAVAAALILLNQLLPFFLVKTSDIPAKIGTKSDSFLFFEIVTDRLLLFCYSSSYLTGCSTGILNSILKVYISLFCVAFILVECNAKIPLLVNSAILQTYFSRGFLYSFVGLICVVEAYSEQIRSIVNHASDSLHISWLSIMMEITSWIMLSCGFAYMLLGLCCLRLLRDRMKDQENEAWRQYKEDVKEWKARYG